MKTMRKITALLLALAMMLSICGAVAEGYPDGLVHPENRRHIIEGGVDVINLQDLVNGVDWIKENLKGRVCIELDVDRQNVTCFGTPRDIDRLIKTEIETLGSPEGGLMMIYGLYPGTPLENAIALMDAMEKYAGYYR